MEHIVPITVKLKERQQARIGVDTFRYYDDPLNFKSGNAKPHGNPEWIVEQGRKMYAEMSPETDAFFNYMIENELLDLHIRQGKDGSGYCSVISKYDAPFIFANFNGTAADIDVLTHEVGHAFQAYYSLAFKVPEYEFPTPEAAEIHSMSMEFLAWPWMDLFFKEDTAKYKFAHLSHRLLLLPNGCMVDEFQHFVYANPDATQAERKRVYRELEQKYVPYRNVEGNDLLERGGAWLQNAHVFCLPFYYVDYLLAQICAFQFWKRSNENRQAVWDDYVRICTEGGRGSFLELMKLARLQSPLEDGCVASVAGYIEHWFANIADQEL